MAHFLETCARSCVSARVKTFPTDRCIQSHTLKLHSLVQRIERYSLNRRLKDKLTNDRLIFSVRIFSSFSFPGLKHKLVSKLCLRGWVSSFKWVFSELHKEYTVLSNFRWCTPILPIARKHVCTSMCVFKCVRWGISSNWIENCWNSVTVAAETMGVGLHTDK